MYYIPYMILKNQLMDEKKAKLIIEGVEVFFEANPEKKSCTVKAKIYYPLESLTSSLKENLHSLDYVKLQGKGGYLKAYPEDGFVILCQDIKVISSFTLFKLAMKHYMSTYDLWRSVVDDMIKSDGLLLI